jgi:hypothetical protein
VQRTAAASPLTATPPGQPLQGDLCEVLWVCQLLGMAKDSIHVELYCKHTMIPTVTHRGRSIWLGLGCWATHHPPTTHTAAAPAQTADRAC